MKRDFVHLCSVALLAALVSVRGCGSKNIQTVPTKEPSVNAIYTAGAATLSARYTEKATLYALGAGYAFETETFSAELTQGAQRNPSTTPYIPHTPTPVTPSPTITPTHYNVPKWIIDPKGSNFALIVLDYQTLEFKTAYFEVFEPCLIYGTLKSDVDLVSQASTVLKRTGSRPGLQYVGDFALFEILPGDIGGAAVLDPCTGQVLFAGSIGMGGGDQIYPVHPIEPDAFEFETKQIRQPQRIDVIACPASTNVEGFEAAWNSVQSLNLVQDFASYGYSAFIYLYAPFVYEFYPPDAEWLIFLHRGPSQ